MAKTAILEQNYTYEVTLYLAHLSSPMTISMQKNTTLKGMHLAYNGLAIPGAKAMAKVLTQNDTLIDLDLTCNRIFDEGAMEIGKALLTNETLCKLKVGVS